MMSLPFALLFWCVSAVMLLFGIMVVFNRNPVASALSLVLSFIALAALYISLDATFLGIIQVLVYAGAVMVLFLFIIMLLDLKAEVRRKINLFTFLGGATVALVFVVQLCTVLSRFPNGAKSFPALPPGRLDDAHNIGMILFTEYNLPFQVIGVLILVATVGVVVLSMRELR